LQGRIGDKSLDGEKRKFIFAYISELAPGGCRKTVGAGCCNLFGIGAGVANLIV
jgi:hypothetical protein